MTLKNLFFHGTRNGGLIAFQPIAESINFQGDANLGLGIFLTQWPSVAGNYSDDKQGGGFVAACMIPADAEQSRRFSREKDIFMVPGLKDFAEQSYARDGKRLPDDFPNAPMDSQDYFDYCRMARRWYLEQGVNTIYYHEGDMLIAVCFDPEAIKVLQTIANPHAFALDKHLQAETLEIDDMRAIDVASWNHRRKELLNQVMQNKETALWKDVILHHPGIRSVQADALPKNKP